MKRLNLMLTISALLVCFMAPTLAQAEHADLVRAAKKFQQMVKDGRTENLMTRVDLYALAGLSFQPGLTVPQKGNLLCKDEEQRRVLAGMYLFDMNYALAFGHAKTALQTQRYFREEIYPSMPVADKLEWSPVNGNLIKQLLEDPNNPELRAKLINQATRNTMKTAEVSSDKVVMDYVVDAFYGSLVEGLYVACTLAKDMEISPETANLFLGQLERFSMFDELFSSFQDKDSLEFIEFYERNDLLQLVMERIKATQGRMSQADIELLLAKVTPARDAIIAPCK